jgi:hypothetical protein
MMIPLITFLLATATACLTLAIAAHKGDILKAAPWWVELLLFTLAGLLYALAGILAVWHLIREKRKDKHPNQIPPASGNPINISFENIGNPIQKQSNEQLVSAPLSRPTHRVKLPEVKPLPSRIGRLRDFVQFAGDTPMLLLLFRSDSVFGQDLEFSAHIVYWDSDGKEITDVARGTWFPLTRNQLRSDFKTGITRELAVLFFANGRPIKALLHWLQESAGRSIVRSPEVWSKADEITKTISTIEVRLLSGDNEPMIFRFELARDSASPFPSLLRRD